MPVSAQLNGEYGFNDIFIGVPAVIGRSGIKELVSLNLTQDEYDLFKKSAEMLKGIIKKM